MGMRCPTYSTGRTDKKQMAKTKIKPIDWGAFFVFSDAAIFQPAEKTSEPKKQGRSDIMGNEPPPFRCCLPAATVSFFLCFLDAAFFKQPKTLAKNSDARLFRWLDPNPNRLFLLVRPVYSLPVPKNA